MHTRAYGLAMALVCLATACIEEATLPPWEAEAPPFAFSLYFDDDGGVKPGSDVLLVRRPEHLERVYALSSDMGKPGQAQAERLFRLIQGQFEEAGIGVARQVVSLRCAAVELPDCVPKWRFIDELLGPQDGPGSRRLRRTLADAFEATARQQGMENTLVLATVNVLLAGGMVKSVLGKAATAEARATVLAEHRAMVEGPAAPTQRLAAEGGRAAAVGAEQLAGVSGRLGVAAEVSAIEARLVEAEALEAGARQKIANLPGLRPSLEQPPAGVAADNVLWRDYVSYWERRYLELTEPAGAAAGVKPPLTWTGYQAFRSRFGRAMEFQARVSALLRAEVSLQPAEQRVLRGMKQPRVDTNVGLKREGRASVTYADDLAVDESTLTSSAPHVESVSTKQRDFMSMDREQAAKRVQTDAREALGKYGGEVEVRRRGHPLFERRLTVSRVHLIYDGALVPNDQAFRRRMLNAAKRAGVELHFHHAR